MLSNALTSEEVPSRVHYLIQAGQLRLPPAASLEIIHKKQEMQAMLRLLNRLYVRLLCQGRLEIAEQVLHRYRGLEELRFTKLFGEFGFPDEVEASAEREFWLNLF